MEEKENEELPSIYERLEKIKSVIKASLFEEYDMREKMKEFIQILKDITSKDSIEEYFNNNKELFNYFIDPFLKDNIMILTYNDKIYGEKGLEIALELLFNIFNLFLKFHKNENYTDLFKQIREIFSGHEKLLFNYKFEDGKEYDLEYFNSEFCSEFKKATKKFEKGEEIDFPYELKSGSDYFKKVWLRGKIEDIKENTYIINFCEKEKKYIDINNINISKGGTKTLDWDWRLGLKKYDVIDCFDRSRWYPATILGVKEKEINGYKKIEYRIAFRLYINHFKNPYDETDTYENHIDFWKSYDQTESGIDNEGEKYIGDEPRYDEDIPFYSKRIQKFGSYSVLQQKNLSFKYNNNNINEDNELKRKTDILVNDTEIDIENFFLYEKERKKNFILGKIENRFYYNYAYLLKLIEKNKGYDIIIDILKDNPNSEEIYNIFYFLTQSFYYLHSGYFLENGNIIKSALINYINNLNDKNIRKVSKELMKLIRTLINEINRYFYKEEEINNDLKMNEEITLAFAMKSIKTSIFDYRLKGIKDLNEIIENNKNNKEIITKIISLLKENKILNELFGANYHSQLIKSSEEIIKILLKENALDENDMTLIWSCTKRGDLEAKLIIIKLLTSLGNNLNENHVEMLLNSVISNDDKDKKISKEELDFVFNLSIHNENEKNMMHCCDYLCQIFFQENSQTSESNEKSKLILEKITLISSKNEKCLKKILNICENGLEKNENSIQCFMIISSILNFFNQENSDNKEELKEVINEFTKDNHLINLLENNLKLYLAKAKEILEKNKISPEQGDNNKKLLIDNFSHEDNIKKRLDILPYLINEYYPDYDFLPFLKNILVINPIESSDQLLFYDFIKKFISDKKNTNKISDKNKNKLREEIFKLISKEEKNEINLEQLKLFITIFLEMNKEKIIFEDNTENEIKEVIDINELTGLDTFWDIIFKINDERNLSFGINIIYQIYKEDNIQKLFDKCNNYFIKAENTNEKLINKYITLMKLILIESEKNILFIPKSHLSLLKNCLINLPFEIKGKEIKIREDTEKFLVFGNTNLIDAKILISQIYEIPYYLIEFSYSKNFLKYLKKNKLLEKVDQIKDEFILDESYNNSTLFDLIIKNDKNSNLLPKNKIKFSTKKPKEEKLLINNEINPKFKKILQEWFIQFTEGTMQMDEEGTARFIVAVTPSKSPVHHNDTRIKNFLKEDKDNRGYVNEEEFINFFLKALKDPRKSDTVWSNLEQMGIGKDLKKNNEINENNVNFYESEKLPRYILGNNLNYVENLIKKYYENPEKYFNLIDFLFFLSTNEKVYDNVLDKLFDEENNNNDNDKENDNCFFMDAFKEKNKYVELYYIFIIIESILQDFEAIHLNYSSTNDFIILDNKVYKLVSSKYEPFDNDEKVQKKLNFVKKIIRAENFQLIINHINDSLENLNELSKQNKSYNHINPILFDFCLRGIKIINIINNYFSINDEKENYKLNIKQTDIYYLGFKNLSNYILELNLRKEFEKLSYKNLADNLIKILSKNSFDEENKENPEEKINNLKKECFDLLIKILSCNKQLIESYKNENETENKEIINLFIDKFTENESQNKELFIQNIKNSVEIAEKNGNKNYIEFLSKLVNNLLDSLINSENKSESKNDKNQFVPDNSFFDLYNHLQELNSVEKNDNIINESALKIYELITKNISDSTYNNKLFLSFMQLLNLQISSNEEIKEQILFKQQKNNKNFFDFLFEHAFPELLNIKNEKSDSKEEEKISLKNDKDSENKEESEEKYIFLENIKEEKKEEINDDLSEELNQICNEILMNCFNHTKNPKLIRELLNIIYLQRNYDKKNKSKNNNKNKTYDYYSNNNNKTFELTSKSTPKKFGHVGLKNLGCICYMNSILQQMYMVPTFRYAIMSSDDHKEPSNPSFIYELMDDNLLHQLQVMYTNLTYSNKSDFSPRAFCYSYKDFDGNPTNVRMQQDSQEFYNNFCDKIENGLKLTKYKYIINDVFVGQSCSSVECSNCKSLSNRFEDFYNLTLEVKNIYNLNDSLNKMSVPEIIDDFKCSNCNQKVTISKITSLNKLPNVLVVHLKRFYLNYDIFKTMKINSKFEFPKELNLKKYCISEIQKDSKNKNKNDEIYIHEDDYYQYERTKRNKCSYRKCRWRSLFFFY